jgi:iron complex transport system ATP-binding protein
LSLIADDVSFVYGQKRPVHALDGVTVALASGTIVALLGPNGSGKSTLLRTLSGGVRPTRGRVIYQGSDLHRLPPRERARRLAFVPQQVRVDFPFTVREVVMMGRAPYQGQLGLERGRDAEIVEEAMERMRVHHLEGRRMCELSGGEAQRVMLAQALAQEPEILLLDEPTSHLDINFQAEIMDLLAALNAERGLTVLASLHDLNLASLYCHSVVLLRGGRLHGEGPPLDVLTESAVREVYGARVHVGRFGHAELPLVTILPRSVQGASVGPGTAGPGQKEDGPAAD